MLTPRFTLTPAPDKPGWWIIFDSESGITCEFKEHEFNETQDFNIPEVLVNSIDAHNTRDLAGKLAALTNAIGRWAAAYHYNLIMPPVEIPMRLKIGRQVAYLRQCAGLTTTELGERAGITQTNISKIENGRYNVSVDILGRIAAALGADLTLE